MIQHILFLLCLFLGHSTATIKEMMKETLDKGNGTSWILIAELQGPQNADKQLWMSETMLYIVTVKSSHFQIDLEIPIPLKFQTNAAVFVSDEFETGLYRLAIMTYSYPNHRIMRCLVSEIGGWEQLGPSYPLASNISRDTVWTHMEQLKGDWTYMLASADVIVYVPDTGGTGPKPDYLWLDQFESSSDQEYNFTRVSGFVVQSHQVYLGRAQDDDSKRGQIISVPWSTSHGFHDDKVAVTYTPSAPVAFFVDSLIKDMLYWVASAGTVGKLYGYQGAKGTAFSLNVTFDAGEVWAPVRTSFARFVPPQWRLDALFATKAPQRNYLTLRSFAFTNVSIAETDQLRVYEGTLPTAAMDDDGLAMLGFTNATNAKLIMSGYSYTSSSSSSRKSTDVRLFEKQQQQLHQRSDPPLGCLATPLCTLDSKCPTMAPPVKCYGPYLSVFYCCKRDPFGS